ncbi:MAG: hypothetical protein JXA11_00120, partial [Phycisphaerae bacterium]|nr:hypothetical protein [Phycisphaerae bacterium]
MTCTGKFRALSIVILMVSSMTSTHALGVLWGGFGAGDSGTNMTDTPPGEAVTLDYTPMLDPADILDVADFTILFQPCSWLDRVRIRLSDDTEFTIDDIGNRRQVTWNFYDPTYVDPDTILYEYKSPITQALKKELMDGVFSAHIWIENDLGDWVEPTDWSFSGTVGYDLVPEPTMVGCMLIGGFYLVGKRKK